jgi:hypothetical protein
MSPSDLQVCLASVVPTKQPVFVWGPPGVGKSSIVAQTASAMALEFCDVRAVLLDPVDLRGLPYFRDGVCQWARPGFLPSAGAGILFLDELPQSAPLVQSALLSLTLDRAIGEYQLPDDWTIVAAGNRQEDRAGGHRIITPLLNRFLHLDLEVSHDDWHSWAAGAGVAPVLRSFLKFRPELLFKFDATSGARSFPTPRSWAFVSTILPTASNGTLMPLVAGCVGEGAAAEFVAFNNIWTSLPDVDGVLKAPTTATVPTSPDVLYALCGAIAEKCRGADKAKLAAAVTYCGRLPKEFQVVLMNDARAANPGILQIPAGQAWIRANRDLLLGC